MGNRVHVGDKVAYLGLEAECVTETDLYFTIKLPSGRLCNLSREPSVPAPKIDRQSEIASQVMIEDAHALKRLV